MVSSLARVTEPYCPDTCASPILIPWLSSRTTLVLMSIRRTRREPAGGNVMVTSRQASSVRSRRAARTSSTNTLTTIGSAPRASNVVETGIRTVPPADGTKNDACPPDHRKTLPSAALCG